MRAKADYDHRYRFCEPNRLRSRIRAKAQFRAYQTLARRYPEEYREAYEIEVIRVREETEMLAATESPAQGE